MADPPEDLYANRNSAEKPRNLNHTDIWEGRELLRHKMRVQSGGRCKKRFPWRSRWYVA